MTNTHEPAKQRGLGYYLRLLATGFAMGSADVVPGVSGGTIAFIAGVYEDLLQAIRSVDLHFFQLLLQRQFKAAFEYASLGFLIALGGGIGLAILTISPLLIVALEDYPVLVWSFFFGLVLASVFVVGRRLPRWTAPAFLLTGLTAVGSYLLVGMVPVETPDAPWFLFLSGALAICAMILPGISGAFILLILGKYRYLLEAVVNRDFLPVFIVMAGAAVGIMSFARLLRWLLKRYHDLTVAALIGLVIGALRKVWPWKELPANITATGEEAHLLEMNVLPEAFTGEVAAALALMALGFGLVFLIDFLGRRVSPRAAVDAASTAELH
jgi:putative membrane protein